MNTLRYLAAAAGAGLLALGAPLAAKAATVAECNEYAMATYVMEPWEQNSRTFYNGQVRVAVVDTDGEPVCCSSWLVVIFPDVGDELGGRTCRIVGHSDSMGFTGIDVKGIKTSYDAATGLTLTVPVRRMIDGDAIRPEKVTLLLNLRGGSLTVRP